MCRHEWPNLELYWSNYFQEEVKNWGDVESDFQMAGGDDELMKDAPNPPSPSLPPIELFHFALQFSGVRVGDGLGQQQPVSSFSRATASTCHGRTGEASHQPSKTPVIQANKKVETECSLPLRTPVPSSSLQLLSTSVAEVATGQEQAGGSDILDIFWYSGNWYITLVYQSYCFGEVC